MSLWNPKNALLTNVVFVAIPVLILCAVIETFTPDRIPPKDSSRS